MYTCDRDPVYTCVTSVYTGIMGICVHRHILVSEYKYVFHPFV